MSQRVAFVCDGCGKDDLSDDDVVVVRVKTGRRGRPPTADLCTECAIHKAGIEGLVRPEDIGLEPDEDEVIDGQLGFDQNGTVMDAEQIETGVTETEVIETSLVGPPVMKHEVGWHDRGGTVSVDDGSVVELEPEHLSPLPGQPDVDPPGERWTEYPTQTYLSGPISLGGKATEAQIEENRQRLRSAEQVMTLEGRTVFNPESLPDDLDWSWEQFMRICIVQLAQSKEVVVMPGWQTSRGARLEVFVAGELGIPVTEYVEPLGEWPT